MEATTTNPRVIACLTYGELARWSTDSASLNDEQRAHLNTCPVCQALTEQLPTLNPEASAQLFVQTLHGSVSSRSRSALRLGGSIAAAVVAMLFGWLWSHSVGLAGALASETRRSDALEAALAEALVERVRETMTLRELRERLRELETKDVSSPAAKGIRPLISALEKSMPQKKTSIVKISESSAPTRVACDAPEIRLAAKSFGGKLDLSAAVMITPTAGRDEVVAAYCAMRTEDGPNSVMMTALATKDF